MYLTAQAKNNGQICKEIGKGTGNGRYKTVGGNGSPYVLQGKGDEFNSTNNSKQTSNTIS